MSESVSSGRDRSEEVKEAARRFPCLSNCVVRWMNIYLRSHDERFKYFYSLEMEIGLIARNMLLRDKKSHQREVQNNNPIPPGTHEKNPSNLIVPFGKV